MSRRARMLPLLLALTLPLAACGDSSAEPEPPPPTVTGSWTGTSQSITLNLTLSEGLGGSVAGSGNIVGPDRNIALIVRQGTHVYPDLTMILGATGYTDMNFTGRLSGATQMSGTLNGSGFDNFNLNLTKR
jgi:hypothetical protein